ncbi:hypothetical protein HUT09_15285 [Streptomyces microflavus]|uniref:Uncharacterized protein n=1 Tax=Streptomyces microflavus TaxID=1919 RepID=A0A7H8MP80_STRMI|nr:hypothetical protein HUT09_15285 [Streptomyces microflavus]
MLTEVEGIDRKLLDGIAINEHAQSTYEANWGQTEPTPPPPGNPKNSAAEDEEDGEDEEGEAEAS